ncbi:leucyl aminopeptidase family protein [Pararhodonellum marinum]|uniref:leucyl aminopeptidase family protein n=1 Tax=Pararhodonellum marinum TaxID=2755358 RepID=UPI00188FFF24|nr:leucyl aminopeptidase family protein [Pararhodonellum marinum]
MTIKLTQDIVLFRGMILIPIFDSKWDISKSLNIALPIPEIFSGKKDQLYFVQDSNTGNTLAFLGLGDQANFSIVKTVFRRLAAKHRELFGMDLLLLAPKALLPYFYEAAVSGLLLGTYQLGHFKDGGNLKPHPLLQNTLYLAESDKSFLIQAQKGEKLALAQLEAMKMVDLPPNKATPAFLSQWASDCGMKFGIEVEVLGRKAAEKEGLAAFIAVGKGSDREPQFIIMKYRPKTKKGKPRHIGLVGKGVTFDTGGLNIKTAGMVHMKCDMGGAAAVLGAMQLIADLKFPHSVTAIIPCVENAIDSHAFLPSEVINSYSGKTIEIIDTDAEGRLILADGLSYLIDKFKPETILDFATLTGSSVSTFGYTCGALFTNNEPLSKTLQESGMEIGEKVWPLPLWDDYSPDIESDIADVKNYSGKPLAGAITAAKFLEFFTEKHESWAHMDIAGVAFGDSEFAKTKHATGFGVHLIAKFVENL